MLNNILEWSKEYSPNDYLTISNNLSAFKSVLSIDRECERPRKDITKFDIEHEIKMVRFNGIEPVDIIDKLFSYKSFFKLIEDFNNFFDTFVGMYGVYLASKARDFFITPHNDTDSRTVHKYRIFEIKHHTVHIIRQ